MKKKNILAENMRRFGTKNLSEQEVPNDKIVKIMGSEPYYKVIYQEGGKNIEIDFEDYEVMDKHDYGAAMAVYGTDNMGNGWVVSADAVSMGGGDFDWDFEWDSLEKQHGGSNSNTNADNTPNIPYTEWDIIDTIDGVYHLVAEYKGKYYMGLADKVGHVVGLDADMDIYDVEEIDKAEYDRLS